jgi:hypothetical protein
MAELALKYEDSFDTSLGGRAASAFQRESLLSSFGVLRGAGAPGDALRLLRSVLVDPLSGLQRSWMLDDRFVSRSVELVDLARFVSFAKRYRDELADVRVAWVTTARVGESRLALIEELPLELRIFEDTTQAYRWLAPND